MFTPESTRGTPPPIGPGTVRGRVRVGVGVGVGIRVWMKGTD